MPEDDVAPRTRESVRVLLDLDLVSEAMIGTVTVDGELPQPFVGWIGLTVVLDRITLEAKGRGQWAG